MLFKIQVVYVCMYQVWSPFFSYKVDYRSYVCYSLAQYVTDISQSLSHSISSNLGKTACQYFKHVASHASVLHVHNASKGYKVLGDLGLGEAKFVPKRYCGTL